MMAKRSGPRIYPVPAEEIPARDFELTVNGRPVFTHPARVSAYPVNGYCRNYQRPLGQTEIASFACWEMSAPVEVSVRSTRPIESVRVRPASAGIAPQVDGSAISFAIEKPGQYTVEVNGTHRALHLFADPPERDSPKPDDPGVRTFGPGVHCAGLIRMESGQTLYLAAGAVVYGAILAEKVRDITIRGRGILDGSRFSREHLTGLVCLYDCENVLIEGITLRDSPVFNVMPMACHGMHIRNIKLIGNWRYNSDGVDFSNCRDCSLEDSFLRTFDDSVCVKGYESFGPFLYRLRLAGESPMDRRFTVDGVEGTFAELQRRFGTYPCLPDVCDNIRVRGCVIWCDWGRPLEVGAETEADEIHDLRFEECDLIHNICGSILSVQNSDRARCRDIIYRDIRVELDDEPRRPVIVKSRDEPYEKPYDGHLPVLIWLANKIGYVTADEERGRIEDVHFENIRVTAPNMPLSRLIGFDADHLVQRVAIENLTLNGRRVTDLESANIQLNEFARDVTIR
jgi:hypothetical protein